MNIAYHWIVVGLLFVADQWSKSAMSERFPLCVPGRCETLEVLPVFKLTVLHNTGAAFSFLDDAGGWQRWFLVAVSTGVSIFIAGWMIKVYRNQRLLAWALTLILGGALGNLSDRVLQGYVVDFLVFHYENHYFPAFNLADTAISIGAGLLILDMVLHREIMESRNV
ncbi:MAG: signal peptidase II [Candidatus Azotimanducaceae bacterium]|jgi:signal peptidase II